MAVSAGPARLAVNIVVESKKLICMKRKKVRTKTRRIKRQHNVAVTRDTHSTPAAPQYFEDGYYYSLHAHRTVIAAGLANAVVLE